MPDYLTDLADVLRSVGLRVVEVGAAPGQVGSAWKARSRGGSGYGDAPGRPNHVMAHHTAGGRDGWEEANYCTFTHQYHPVANLVLDRAGVWFVCAAGATNTNGAGRDPCGLLAPDSMNANAIGIEACNRGTGEVWPAAQLDSYERGCWALCARYGIPFARIHGHAEYAPERKIDPAGPPRYNGGTPDAARTWTMGLFRAAAVAAGGDDMATAEEVWKEHLSDPLWAGGAEAPASWWLTRIRTDTSVSIRTIEAKLARLQGDVVNLALGQLNIMSAVGQVDEETMAALAAEFDAIIDGVVDGIVDQFPGMPAEAVKAIAKATIDELHGRTAPPNTDVQVEG